MAAKKTSSSSKRTGVKTPPPSKAGSKKASTASNNAVSKKKAPAKKKAAAPKPAAKKTPASKKTVASKKASTSKKATAAGKGKAAAKSTPPAPTVVSSLSAAAKRIQEREEKRKQRTAARLAASRPSPKINGNKPKTSKTPAAKSLSSRELQKFKNLLLEFRDRIVGDIQFLTTDNLHRMGRETGADLSGASQHSADHGTDNFDREFALSLATTEQDVLYEVDEALMRIEEGTYGFCEMTGVAIEKARLEVIPYTRYSVQAQARMEQGRAKYRPFAQAFKSW